MLNKKRIKVLEKIKAINDLKSEIGFIKKHFMGQDHMKENSAPCLQRFGQRVPRTMLAKQDLLA
jgi:hypothetical protein